MGDKEGRTYAHDEVQRMLEEARVSSRAEARKELMGDADFRGEVVAEFREKELPTLLAEARAEERKLIEGRNAAFSSLNEIKPLTDDEVKAFTEKMEAGEFDLEKETLRRRNEVLEAAAKSEQQTTDQDGDSDSPEGDKPAGKKDEPIQAAAWTPNGSGTQVAEAAEEDPAKAKQTEERVPLLSG